VFNLRVRDDLIAWTVNQRKMRLVNVMDAYVLGAIPPYNFLLCGKLVACLVRSKEVRDSFAAKYDRSRGIISGVRKHARLALVTTSSALGRSSMYNRLTIDGTRYFESIGYTSGWGHFHIPASLFELIREYLKLKKHEYQGNNRFGEGPNWRLRAIRQALSTLGLNPNLLQHGINREVFICQLASNAARFLAGKAKRVEYRGLRSVSDVSRLAIARWVLPRSVRRTEYQNWKRENMLQFLMMSRSALPTMTKNLKEVDQGGAR
jgi:hypothetical protein